MRHVRVLAALLVLSLIALSGCSDDDPDVGTSAATAATDQLPATAATDRPASTTTTTDRQPGDSPDSPIARGQVGHVSGWDVKVIGITRIDKDIAGDAPPAGFAFLVYEIEGTRTDPEPQSIILLSPSLLGPSKVERNAASDPLCFSGNPANEEAHQGGTVRHSACVSVPEGDVGHVVAKIGGFGDERWFATQ